MTRRSPRVTSTVKLAAALCAAWMLTACDTPTPAVVDAPATVELVRASNIGPGPQSVSADRAAAYFTSMCDAADRGRSSLEAVAAQNGFAQNSATSTYYHQKEDLSIKLVGSSCSIVFTSKDDPSRVVATMSAASATLRKVSAEYAGFQDGRHYFRAGAEVKG